MSMMIRKASNTSDAYNISGCRARQKKVKAKGLPINHLLAIAKRKVAEALNWPHATPLLSSQRKS